METPIWTCFSPNWSKIDLLTVFHKNGLFYATKSGRMIDKPPPGRYNQEWTSPGGTARFSRKIET